MNAVDAFLALLTPDQVKAVHGALFPPAPPAKAPVAEPTPPARMTDAEFLAALPEIAAGRRNPADAARQRQVIPGGSALPPAEISRSDTSVFLANLSAIAAGKTRVVG